jgi:heme/copper-type cytochrome/quinol oxidase subunit 2
MSNITNFTGNQTLNLNLTLTDDELNTVVGLTLFSSALSLLGSLFISFIFIYLKCQIFRKNSGGPNNSSDPGRLKMGYGHNLIFYLSLSDLVLSISNFIKISNFHEETDESLYESSACIAQGVIMNFSELSSICWTSVISYSIYYGTITLDPNKLKKILFWSFFYAYGVPLILTVGPAISDSYGPAGAWCWLNTQDLSDDAAWAWSLLIYIFSWMNIAFNIFAVWKSINYFKIRAFEIKEDDQVQSNFLRNFCIVLKFFPIILVICWFFPTVNRIYSYAAQKENMFLYTMQGITGSLMGFFNAIVYSYYYRSIIPCWDSYNKKLDQDISGVDHEKKEVNNQEFVKNLSEHSIDKKNDLELDNIKRI